MASPYSRPFFVPPKVSTSTPASTVISAERAAQRRHRVRDPRAVEEQQQALGVGGVGEGANLLDGVDRPYLRRLADRQDRRVDRVLASPGEHQRLDLLGPHLAVVCRHAEHLAPDEAFGSPALVGVDVRADRADHRLVRQQHRMQRGDVRSRPAVGEQHLRLDPEQPPHPLDGPRRPRIAAVRQRASDVGLRQGREHLRVCASHVVAREQMRRRDRRRGIERGARGLGGHATEASPTALATSGCLRAG